jgi:catechol 2,3-dioxygenase-like lactoylglutathione lyase family enzyme
MKVEAIDHLHLCVPDLAQAKALFGTLAGGEFTEVYGGEEWWNCWVVWNTIGLEIMQPIRDGEPIVGTKSSRDKGIIAVAFRVTDLEAAIPPAEALGLRLVGKSGSEEAGFGKWIVQAQFDPRNSLGVMVELAERQRPDDPLLTAFRHLIDRIEFYVHDLPRAAQLFSALTGHPFPAPIPDARLDALTTTNDLGLQFVQPLSKSGPAGRMLASQGEGVRAIAFRAADLEASIAKAESLGLQLVQQHETKRAVREAEFDPRGSYGMTVKLTERPDGA